MKPRGTEADLVRLAMKARKHAYAPYSNYRVGASVEGGSGAVYTACNIENASFGLTVCAERNAIFHAIAAGERTIVAMALAADNGGTPCGACRQVLAEFADEETPVWIREPKTRKLLFYRLAELLPARFRPEQLGRAK